MLAEVRTAIWLLDGVTLHTDVALAFPAPADMVLRHPPLLVVLTQVKFPRLLTLLSEPGVVGFQEAIRDTFPIMERVDGAGIMIGPAGVQAEQHAPIFKFTDDSKQWTVTLSMDSVALETAAYTHAADFIDRFDRVVDALDRTVHPSASTRVGFRKVNELVGPTAGDVRAWRNLLNPALVGALADALPGHIEQAFSILLLKDEEGGHLSVQHGVLDDPDKYRLDLDYWTDQPYVISGRGELRNLLKSYAESETQFFVWSLNDTLYKQYEPVPRSSMEETQ